MSDKRRIPNFRYPGAKKQLAPAILRHAPKRGRKFIDLFAGRGSITFCAMETLDYQQWVLNDILTAPFFYALRDQGDRFRATEKSKDEFARLAALAKKGDPHALLMEPYLCFNGGTYDSGGSTTAGGRRSPLSYETSVRLTSALLRHPGVRITKLDWWDCLQCEQPGPEDFVMVDGPYIGCEVGPYSPDSICPTELIEYLKSAPFPWLFCEYPQPLYLQAFGEPVHQQKVQCRSTNFTKAPQQTRIECVWSSERLPKRDTVTVGGSLRPQPVPADRKDSDYAQMSTEKLLREIRECAAAITAARNSMNAEMRKRLLPALLQLKKRTYRKKPGFYATLASMGFNADTVRQWFYRSHTADEVIELIEEEPEPAAEEREGGRPTDAKSLLLEHADKMAKALLENKITYAKRLATEYVRVRDENQ